MGRVDARLKPVVGGLERVAEVVGNERECLPDDRPQVPVHDRQHAEKSDDSSSAGVETTSRGPPWRSDATAFADVKPERKPEQNPEDRHA